MLKVGVGHHETRGCAPFVILSLLPVLFMSWLSPAYLYGVSRCYSTISGILVVPEIPKCFNDKVAV